jgi:PAS domain S-box-containing protein
MLWSQAAESLLGFPSDALVGRDVDILLGDDAEMVKVAHEAIAGVLRDGEPWSGIVRLRHRDGQDIRLEARLSLLENGDGVPFLLCRFADATALLGLEQGLAVQEALFEQSPLGLAIFDRDLRYVRVNERLARMNGLPVGEHLGRTAGQALPQLAADEVMAVQRQVLATGEPVIDVTCDREQCRPERPRIPVHLLLAVAGPLGAGARADRNDHGCDGPLPGRGQGRAGAPATRPAQRGRQPDR